MTPTVRALGLVTLLASGAIAAPSAQTAGSAAQDGAKAEAYFEFLRGRQLEGEGDVEGAARALRRGIERDPASGELRAELAALYARQNRPQEAIEAGEAALEADPDNAEAHWVLGSVYAALSRDGEGAAAPASDPVDKAIYHLQRAQPSRRYDVGLALTLGRLHLAKRDYGRAIETLQALVQQEPGVTEAGWLLSQAYQSAGRTEEAIRALEGVLALQPDFYRGLLALAELYERQRDWNSAATALGRAAEVNPRFVELRLRQATSMMNAGRPEEARDLLRVVALERPTEPSVLYALSEAEREAGSLDEAETAARRVLALEPTGLRGPYALARIYERRHDPAQVVAVLEPAVTRARAAQPDAEPEGRQLTTLLAHLGFAYMDLGEPDKAIATFERAREAGGSDSPFDVYLAQAHLSAKHYDRVAAIAEAARARGTHDPRLARLEAQALLQEGRADEAFALLRGEVERRPEHVDVHVGLASALGEAHRVDEALAVLDAASARFPGDVGVAFQRGVVLERNRRYVEAERAFLQALTLDASHGPTLNYLGYMLADRGERLDEAVKFVERALETDPLNPSYIDSLGWAHFRRGDLAKARTLLDRAAAALPRNSVVQDHHGDVLAALGDAPGAIAAWERALAGDGQDVDRDAIARKIADAGRK